MRFIIVICITVALGGAFVAISSTSLLMATILGLALWKFIDFIDEFVASCMGYNQDATNSHLMKEYLSSDPGISYEKWLELEIYKLREVERKWEVYQ